MVSFGVIEIKNCDPVQFSSALVLIWPRSGPGPTPVHASWGAKIASSFE